LLHSYSAAKGLNQRRVLHKLVSSSVEIFFILLKNPLRGEDENFKFHKISERKQKNN